MKKYRICAIFAMIFIICTFAACQSQENNTVTKEQVLQALRDNGFEDAHAGYWIYIDADEETYISYIETNSISLHLNNSSNTVELLNAIMPLFDIYFHNSGNYILKELLNEENSFSEGYRCIKYQNHEYNGKLDETNTYISYIWILWK